MRKALSVSVVAAVVAAIVALAGCTGGPKAIPSEEAWSRFVGEWANPEHGGSMYPTRLVVAADFAVKTHWYSNNVEPSGVFRVRPRKCWVDRLGNVYVQVHYDFTNNMGSGAGLMRIDKAGKVLEADWIMGAEEAGATADWAYRNLQEIDPELRKRLGLAGEAAVYWIYHRK